MFESFGRCCDDCKKPKPDYERPHVGAALSPRDKQIVALVSTGKSNKEIANVLLLSEGTIKIYISRIFAKVGVGNRTELAVKFINERVQEERMATLAENMLKLRSLEVPPKAEKPLDCVGVDPAAGKGKVTL